MPKAPNHKYILTVVFARITKAEMARRLGTTRQYISSWERIPLKHARTIAKMLEIPPKILRPDVYD